MYFLYNVVVVAAEFFLKIIALFNNKIRLFVNGRKESFKRIKQGISAGDRTIWIHAASLGEFEQGRPIVERIKKQYSNHKIVITFFSPSGYEVRKDYNQADVVCYLPLDTKSNVKKFLELVRPEMAIFVKYEFWPNMLKALQSQGINTILISGIFREDQVFFKSNSWMRNALKSFSHFFVQDENSKNLLNEINFQNVSISGDTRFDRVVEITEQDNTLDFVETFKGDNMLIVAGSTWKEGELLLSQYINESEQSNVKFLIAPHNISEENSRRLKESISDEVVLFSEMEIKDIATAKVLIVDTIGILTKIYSYADVAYVGGGFATGLHNILEPATFGVPVIIGPQFDKFREARELVEQKGCLVVNNADEMKSQLDTFVIDEDFRLQTGDICKSYIQENIGATEMVLSYVKQVIKK